MTTVGTRLTADAVRIILHPQSFLKTKLKQIFFLLVNDSICPVTIILLIDSGPSL